MKKQLFQIKLIRQLLLAGVLVTHFTNLHSQIYANWMFGKQASLKVDVPVVTNNAIASAMITWEGCASISTPAGAALFYTDGRKVWDAVTNLTYVPAAPLLNCHPNDPSGSATQGVVVIPRPGVPNEYFIYTVSDRGAINHGLTQYTVNSALGTILGGAAETPPLENYATTEQITAIPHCNGVDYWLIVKPISNNAALFPQLDSPGGTFITGDEIMAYLVTNAGIAAVTPVVSMDPNWHIDGAGSGAALLISSPDVVGSFKFSPNKEFFAVAERQATGPVAGFIHLYRFNCSTGQFTHVTTLNQNGLTYGISFSPDSRFIYAQNGANINVYNLANLYDNDCANDTLFPMDTSFAHLNTATTVTQIQMATNGNLYVSRMNVTRVGEITNPNDPTIMNYNGTAIVLSAGRSSLAGLPNDMDAFEEHPLSFTYCQNCHDVCFELIGCDNVITWDFGDGIIQSGAFNAPLTDPNTTGTMLNPCHHYTTPGFYTITVSSIVNGVTETFTQTIHVFDAVLDPLPDLCVNDPLFLLGSPSGGPASPAGGTFTCSTCPPGTIMNTGVGGTTHYFNPHTSGPGTFTIQYITDPDSGCVDTAVQTITVHPDNWNITTSASNKNDEGRDIVTDSEGNVYVVGTFEVQTTFPASTPVTIPVAGLPAPGGSSYLAKYDPCGELIWINYDSESGSGYSRGGSIAIDEASNAVFISGNGLNKVIYQDVPATASAPVPTPTSTPFILGGPVSHFIARFNMTTGQYESGFDQVLPMTPAGNLYDAPGLDAYHDAVTGATDLYYCTWYPSNAVYRTRVGKIRNSGTTYNSGMWPLLSGVNYRESNVGGVTHVQGFDIAYNPVEDNVYVTGAFENRVQFPSSVGSAATSATSTTRDAFFVVMKGLDGDAILTRSGGVAASQSGAGTGVDVDATGATYLTGFVSGAVPVLLGYPAFTMPTVTSFRGYIVKINYTTPVWLRRIRAGSSPVRSSSICVDDINVYVSGTTLATIGVPAGMGAGATYTGTGLAKFFVHALDQSTGNPLWLNTGTDAVANSEHGLSRIACSEDYVYCTGGYKGQFNYQVTGGFGPANILNSTTTVTKNTFIVRNEILLGDFRNASTAEDLSDITANHTDNLNIEPASNEIKVYPNPASEVVNVQLPLTWKDNASLEIVDMNGRTIQIISNISGPVYRLDVQHLAPGVYIFKIIHGDVLFHTKLVKN